MKHGFTLIELMIVVAIIAIIAAIAIPSLLQSKGAANESAVQGSLKTLATQELTYQTRNRYYADFATLKTNTNFDMGLTQYGSNPTATCGTKTGYIFRLVLTGTSPNYTNFSCHAGSMAWKIEGEKRFYVDATGVVRASTPSGLSEGAADDPGTSGFTGASSWNPAG